MSSEHQPNSESRETFRGIRIYEVTTSAWLFDPEVAFAVVNELNKKRAPEDWIRIEVYPTIRPRFLEFTRKLARRGNVPSVSTHIPPYITAEKNPSVAK